MIWRKRLTLLRGDQNLRMKKTLSLATENQQKEGRKLLIIQDIGDNSFRCTIILKCSNSKWLFQIMEMMIYGSIPQNIHFFCIFDFFDDFRINLVILNDHSFAFPWLNWYSLWDFKVRCIYGIKYYSSVSIISIILIAYHINHNHCINKTKSPLFLKYR